MSWNQSPIAAPHLADVRDERVSAFLSKVYVWMFFGLLITAVTAYGVATSPAILEIIFLNRLVFWALLIAQLGLVFYLSARVDKIGPTTAAGLFIVYSTLVGVTSSVILLLYTGSSIASTFIITAGMFGATAIFGTVTKRSLAGLGQFLFMGLIGLVLAMIVGLFWQSGALQFVISVVGVLVFTGLTAWDAQTPEATGCRPARRPRRCVCCRRRPLTLPGLHQPVLLSAAIYRRPPRLSDTKDRVRRPRLKAKLSSRRLISAARK
jgi:FtsH-binding integral membrane protein